MNKEKILLKNSKRLILLGIALFFYNTVFSQQNINLPAEIKNLKSKDFNKKLAAIDKIGKSRDKRYTAELVNELKVQKNPQVKAKIVEALGNTKDDEFVSELTFVVKDKKEDLTVRETAVISLGNIGTSNSVDALTNIAKDENEDISLRLAAIESLARFINNKVFDTLVGLTNDRNPLVRKTSVGFLYHGFYSVHQKQVDGILRKMLNDENEEVRLSARMILEEVEKRNK
jgi:HEAT repeat protein